MAISYRVKKRLKAATILSIITKRPTHTVFIIEERVIIVKKRSGAHMTAAILSEMF